MLIWTFFLLAGCAGSSVSVDAGSDASVDADGADGADLDPGDQASAPVLDSVDPSVGPAAGGTPVTLSGSGFLGGASVRFGAVLATGVEVTSSSSIQVVTPPGSAGAVTLRVTNPDGRFGELAAGFTYLVLVAGDCSRASNCELAAA